MAVSLGTFGGGRPGIVLTERVIMDVEEFVT